MAPSMATRWTDRRDTPARRATSVCVWPAFSKTLISWRLSISHILPPCSGHSVGDARSIGVFYCFRRRCTAPEFLEDVASKFPELAPILPFSPFQFLTEDLEVAAR